MKEIENDFNKLCSPYLIHLVSFISNVYKQQFLQLVGVSENLSNGLVFSRKF